MKGETQSAISRFFQLLQLSKRQLLIISAIVSFTLALLGAGRTMAKSPTLPEDIQGYWAQQCVNYIVGQGIMKTYPDGTFRPNLPVTRGKFADIIVRAFPDAPVVLNYNQDYFVDIPNGYWATAAIRKAFETNFLAGYPDRIFAPLQNIPRVQVIVAIASGFNYTQPFQPTEALLQDTFIDAQDIPGYAKDYVAAAVENRVVVKFPNPRQLDSQQWATRGDIAASLCQTKASPSIIPQEYVVAPGMGSG
ncbi:S-layer homology domain-containing protein [Spirulina sp. CS-785/01]|uniref:S-layer homology domain-containing protein n=1 Tax=Spirulina sp. CS-785/01 TaxID=3021716 RepID=UPI0023307083|nr:S-layer homology domain-containing protein [Spirulina sp. CS-785/01]MDB9311718.1 S-layer homology domain-containing protein [Spirulina sp. CS-785/01]